MKERIGYMRELIRERIGRIYPKSGAGHGNKT